MRCSALIRAKCCNRSYAISKLAKRLKWENKKQNINSKMLNEISIACMKYLNKYWDTTKDVITGRPSLEVLNPPKLI